MPADQDLKALWQAHGEKVVDDLAHSSPEEIRVERYVFSVSGEIAIGNACEVECTSAPEVDIDVIAASCNVPEEGGVWMALDVKESGVWVRKVGPCNARKYAIDRREPMLLPLKQGQAVRVRFWYDGTVWEQFVPGRAFLLILSMKGPAKVTT